LTKDWVISGRLGASETWNSQSLMHQASPMKILSEVLDPQDRFPAIRPPRKEVSFNAQKFVLETTSPKHLRKKKAAQLSVVKRSPSSPGIQVTHEGGQSLTFCECIFILDNVELQDNNTFGGSPGSTDEAARAMSRAAKAVGACWKCKYLRKKVSCQKPEAPM